MAVTEAAQLLTANRIYPRPFRWTPVAGFILLVFATAILSACRQPHQAIETPRKTDPGIHKSYERGPVTCLLDADKSEITIADRLVLTISVITDPDYEAKLPPIGEKLDQFGIVDYHTPAPEFTADGRTKISRAYVLEPFLSGEYTLPAMTVHFWKTGSKNKDLHDITTEKIPIKVNSLLPETLTDMKLHDIRPPVAIPATLTRWGWAAVGGGLLVIILAVFLGVHYRRRKTGSETQPNIPPHEQAYGELEALVARNLIESGAIKRFYQEISNILRRYIENRFGINAPELTTEEFLEGLKANAAFPGVYQDLLKKFLIHCDLVKFAAHQPVPEDIQNTFDSCREFIEGTALKEDGRK